ncbi:hypothetical protein N9219_04245 [bacterium]|nr:hypothetical protein [bacterium]
MVRLAGCSTDNVSTPQLLQVVNRFCEIAPSSPFDSSFTTAVTKITLLNAKKKLRKGCTPENSWGTSASNAVSGKIALENNATTADTEANTKNKELKAESF